MLYWERSEKHEFGYSVRGGILNERGGGPRMDTIVDDAYKKLNDLEELK